MRGVLLFFIFVIFVISAYSAEKSVIIIQNPSKIFISGLNPDYFDITKVTSKYATIIAKQDGIKLLKEKGIKFKYLYKDIEQIYAPYRKKISNNSLYHTYDEVVAELNQYHQQFPQITKLESIGKTFENRDILAIKISDNPETDENEPAVLYMGLHHAREWISTEVPMAIIDKLLNSYGNDDELTKLINNREIWVIPIVNPDGLQYSQFTADWRKDREPNGDGTFGTDPNRNYGYEWGTVGCSHSTGSETYCGKSAFSIAETKAIRDFGAREKFIASISYHSYSQLVLYPWSYTNDIQAKDHDILASLAEGMAELNGYTPEQSASLYPAAGDSDDWLYSQHGTLSFTIELGSTFVPPESEIQAICKKNVDAALYLLKRVGNIWPALKHKPYESTTNTIGPYIITVDIDKEHNPDFSVSSMKLHYKKEGASFYSTSDFYSDGLNTYKAEIPGQEFGSIIHYYISCNNEIRIPEKGDYSFSIERYNRLIVDDDKGKNYQKYIISTMNELKLGYQLYDTSKNGIPNSNKLMGYSEVIWITGDDSSSSLSTQEQDVLKNYLDNGGSLFITGQDIGYDIHDSSFYSDYLHAEYIADNSNLSRINGKLGDNIFDFNISGGDGASNQRYPDVLKAKDGAKVFLVYKPDKYGVGIRASEYSGTKLSELLSDNKDDNMGKGAGIYFKGGYKVVYLGFGFEGISSKKDRKYFLGNVLNWLLPNESQRLLRLEYLYNTKIKSIKELDSYKQIVGEIEALEDSLREYVHKNSNTIKKDFPTVYKNLK